MHAEKGWKAWIRIWPIHSGSLLTMTIRLSCKTWCSSCLPRGQEAQSSYRHVQCMFWNKYLISSQVQKFHLICNSSKSLMFGLGTRTYTVFPISVQFQRKPSFQQPISITSACHTNHTEQNTCPHSVQVLPSIFYFKVIGLTLVWDKFLWPKGSCYTLLHSSWKISLIPSRPFSQVSGFVWGSFFGLGFLFEDKILFWKHPQICKHGTPGLTDAICLSVSLSLTVPSGSDKKKWKKRLTSMWQLLGYICISK